MASIHSRAPFPVTASMRRTPAATPPSEVILKTPMSPVLLTWVPPHSSTEKPFAESQHPDLVLVLFAEQAIAPEATASSYFISDLMSAGTFLRTCSLTRLLDGPASCSASPARSARSRSAGDPARRASLLLHVFAEHLAKRRMHQVRCGMIQDDRGAPLCVDLLPLTLSPALNRAGLNSAVVHVRLARFLRIADQEYAALRLRSHRCRRPGRRFRHRTASNRERWHRPRRRPAWIETGSPSLID